MDTNQAHASLCSPELKDDLYIVHVVILAIFLPYIAITYQKDQVVKWQANNVSQNCYQLVNGSYIAMWNCYGNKTMWVWQHTYWYEYFMPKLTCHTLYAGFPWSICELWYNIVKQQTSYLHVQHHIFVKNKPII